MAYAKNGVLIVLILIMGVMAYHGFRARQAFEIDFKGCPHTAFTKINIHSVRKYPMPGLTGCFSLSSTNVLKDLMGSLDGRYTVQSLGLSHWTACDLMFELDIICDREMVHNFICGWDDELNYLSYRYITMSGSSSVRRVSTNSIEFVRSIEKLVDR